MVDGRGDIIKNGGRVMKNVTGYDLVKLMAGSHGTLGVLTEVAFKVLPMPEASATVVVEGLENNDARAAMSTALTSPFDVNGAAHLPEAAGYTARTYIRVEGFHPANDADLRKRGLDRFLFLQPAFQGSGEIPEFVAADT